MQAGKINILIDGCFGSCGKGNIAAYLAKTHDLSVCAYVGGPNSGHQFIDDSGEVQTVKMLPVSGIVSKNSTIVISAGTIIDTDRLIAEIEKYGVSDRIKISPTAPIVDDACRKYERENLQCIASTFQGTGAAIGLKAMRSDKIRLAKDVSELKQWLDWNTADLIINQISSGQTAIVETSQGYALSVDSEFYPYCTSRPVNVGQSLAYLDVPHTCVGDVIGLFRSYWIRVGNVPEGYSGDVYPDSHEIMWEELSKKLGRDVLEMTTVTKRVRRVFTFSRKGFEQGVRRNGINMVFLTFADYLTDSELEEMKKYLTNEFDFDEIYTVSGFGDFQNNIRRVY